MVGKTKVSFLTLLPGLSIVGQVSRVGGRKLAFLFLSRLHRGSRVIRKRKTDRSQSMIV